MRKPDWTKLEDGLLGSISGFLISDDVADFVRLRAVCRPWRSSTVEAKSRAECLYPRNWIMLSDPDSSPNAVLFFNKSTQDYFSFNLTRYLDTYTLFRSFDCLFLLKHKTTEAFAILNPFMRSITPLPSTVQSNCAEAPLNLEDLIRKKSFDLSGLFVSSSSTIVLVFTRMDRLVWTKPGDQSWVYAEFKVQNFSNVLFYKDRLLTIDPDKGLVQINLANEIPIQPQVEVAIPRNELPSVDYSCYIVDCGEEIFLVSFDTEDCDEQNFWESFEMHELVLDKKTCDRSENLDGCSIFLGENRTISIPCGDYHLVPANSIYLCDLYYGETACYDLGKNRIKYLSRKPYFRPTPLADEIIDYCLR